MSTDINKNLLLPKPEMLYDSQITASLNNQLQLSKKYEFGRSIFHILKVAQVFFVSYGLVLIISS